MAISLEDKKTKARLDRSRALMSKINIIRAKYGSTAPAIESQDDQDTYNSKMLFGQSGSESINFSMPGPEGIVRMYYRIIQNLIGTVRDNNVSNGTADAKSSSITRAAQLITKGAGNLSAYFVNGPTDENRFNGMRGIWNYSGTAFTNNIWLPDSWSVPPGFVYTPPHDSTCIKDVITSTIAILGARSSLGVKSSQGLFSGPLTRAQLINQNTIMGERFTDISPYSLASFIGGEGGGLISFSYTYGNGVWDKDENYSNRLPPGISINPNYWNASIGTLIDRIIAKLSDSISVLNYSKVSNFTYIMNKKCIPGYTTQYSTQNAIITNLSNCINILNDFKSYMSTRGGISSSSTPSQYREQINAYLTDSVFPSISYISSQASAIAAQCESLLGGPTSKGTLKWLRAECVKALIDINGGSRINMIGMDNASETISKSSEKAESEFELYEMNSTEWIPTPQIVGVNQHFGFDRATMSLVVDGFIVAWWGQDHCTSYDVWKSFDYDRNTGTGSWMKILAPGNSFTSQDIDINVGKVITYIIDKDIDKTSGKSPFYKVKAYDNGGEGEYVRTPATSLVCDPMSGEDFPVGGDSPAAVEIVPPPAKVNNSPLTSVRMPGGIYKWPTMLKGSNAKDFERRVFESEVDFDNWGSNLTVYHNGLEVELGPGHEYELVDNRRISFYESIPEEDNIIIHVFFNISELLKDFEQNGGSPSFTGLQLALPYWKAPVAQNQQLPSVGNTEGDIRLVISDAKLFRWTGASWSALIGDGSSGSSGSTYWKDPVTTFEDLPQFGNLDGDVRLVIRTGNLYRWSATDNRWTLLTDGAPFDQVTATVAGLSDLPNGAAPGDLYYVQSEGGYYQWVDPPGEWQIADNVGGSASSSGVRYWKRPVNYKDELPINGNSEGDVRLVISEKALYEWESGSYSWVIITGGSSSTNISGLKPPVDLVADLPTSGNLPGDMRYVYETRKLYIWDDKLTTWISIKAEIDESEIHHDKLNSMPDTLGLNGDHDARYYTKFQFDQMMQQISDRLNSMNNLIPPDALDLSGNLQLKSTSSLSTGYISDGNDQTFNTLRPNSQYEKIFKGSSFTLCNPDSTKYFRQADKGRLEVFINSVRISLFDLGANFEESKRKYGQTYCPTTSSDGVINILSVAPYNSFADYQIGNFEINLSENKLTQGENNIYVRHYIDSDKQYNSYIYTMFYDNATSTIYFDNVTISEKQLISAKYLSGVRYYSLNDALNINLSAHSLYDNTYIDSRQVFIKSEDLAVANKHIDFHSEGSFGVSRGAVGDILRYSSDLTINMSNAYNTSPSLYLSGYRVFDRVENVKFDVSYYVNTLSQASTNTREYFKDEIYRMSEKNTYNLIPSKYTGLWDSSAILGSSQLQVFDSQLMFPFKNYTLNVMPRQTANYSGYDGARYYIRAFKGSSPRNNGTFTLPGFNISRDDVKIEIKLPSLTGWLNMNKLYNEADFTGIDGDGCLVSENSASNSYIWTSGQFSTSHCNFLIIIRVTMLSSNAMPLMGMYMYDWEI